MQLNIPANSIPDLNDKEREQLQKLIDVFNNHQSKNEEKNKYYEGNISVSEVNLGIALPERMKNLEIGCSWGAKAVDVLASRSKFDGFVGTNGEKNNLLDEIVTNNNLIAEYIKACRDELLFGCDFATLSKDKKLKCKIRFHSPKTAAALWNGEKGRVDCGLAIIDTVPDETENGKWIPSIVNFYTDDAIWVFTREDGNAWNSKRYNNKMGRPLIEPLIWNSTSNKPFGRSRIKEPVRRLIQGYVRTLANATIGLEFSTSPQKYLLGVTDDQYDKVVNNKFKQYVGSIIAATTDENGNHPVFGQLAQGSLSPHMEMLRMLATQFSAATGLSVTDTGVVNDANPTSSDAILAQERTLVSMAEQLNAGNGNTLRTIAIMALAIAQNKTLEQLEPEEMNIMAHFKNPAMPSVSVTADAAMKIATSRPNFAGTDVFAEMVGFDQADIRRLKTQERQAAGLKFLTSMVEENNEDETDEQGSEDNNI